MIRVIIVDDELLAGVGIQSLIHGKDDIDVAAVLNSAEDAVHFLRRNVVDVVITDIEMGDMSGLDLIKVIREERLAKGVIILSCHDDFSYAQEAISKGTDSYLLKHSITETTLVEEIKKVYQKHQGQQIPDWERGNPTPKKNLETGQEVYFISVLRITNYGNSHPGGEGRMEKTMLVHLLEGIISQYGMGTLYAPYDREIFMVFEQHQSVPIQDRLEIVNENLRIIDRILRQYINSCIHYGVSTEFVDSEQIHKKYDEAITAVEMSFYKPEQNIFFYQEPEEIFIPDVFTVEHFQAPDGEDVFAEELAEYLRRASSCRLAVRDLRAHLLQSMGKIIYQVFHEHQFDNELIRKWNSNVALVSVVTYAENIQRLEIQLQEVFRQFRQECMAELEGDEMSRVLDYIEQNLEGKIQLTDLAEIGYMSIPTFSRKFKERTGLTLVQYLNERRIERAKVLLRNPKYSLEYIASATGFSSANYLIRVFKKITGKTISEYRG